MRRSEKILVSTLALLFGLLAAGVGYGLAGDSGFSRLGRFACDFIFIMQFLATLWTVIAVFRRTKEQQEREGAQSGEIE